jgi:hypothetical protein
MALVMFTRVSRRSHHDEERPFAINPALVVSVHPQSGEAAALARQPRCNVFTTDSPEAGYEVVGSLEEVVKRLNLGEAGHDMVPFPQSLTGKEVERQLGVAWLAINEAIVRVGDPERATPVALTPLALALGRVKGAIGAALSELA